MQRSQRSTLGLPALFLVFALPLACVLVGSVLLVGVQACWLLLGAPCMLRALLPHLGSPPRDAAARSFVARRVLVGVSLCLVGSAIFAVLAEFVYRWTTSPFVLLLLMAGVPLVTCVSAALCGLFEPYPMYPHESELERIDDEDEDEASNNDDGTEMTPSSALGRASKRIKKFTRRISNSIAGSSAGVDELPRSARRRQRAVRLLLCCLADGLTFGYVCVSVLFGNFFFSLSTLWPKVVACALYPFFILSVKLFAHSAGSAASYAERGRTALVNDGAASTAGMAEPAPGYAYPDMVEFDSTIHAALPYRIIFLGLEDPMQFWSIIAVECVYKLLTYVVAQMQSSALRPILKMFNGRELGRRIVSALRSLARRNCSSRDGGDFGEDLADDDEGEQGDASDESSVEKQRLAQMHLTEKLYFQQLTDALFVGEMWAILACARQLKAPVLVLPIRDFSTSQWNSLQFNYAASIGVEVILSIVIPALRKRFVAHTPLSTYKAGRRVLKDCVGHHALSHVVLLLALLWMLQRPSDNPVGPALW